MAGNHENTEALRAVFADADWMPDGTFLQFVIDRFPVRLICLDTTIEEKWKAHFAENVSIGWRRALRKGLRNRR